MAGAINLSSNTLDESARKRTKGKQTKGNKAAQRKERKEILIFDSKITKSSMEETNKKCDERLY